LLLATRQLGLQRFSDSFGDLALNPEDVSQLAIITLSPEMGIGLRVNQLNIDPHLIGHFLDATLKNVRYAKLLRDLAEIGRFALILLRGSARDYF
jgi:hypothetical protein